jgi:segregation and condensation protein B
MLTRSAQLEALLFWKGEPVKIKKLAEMLGVEAGEIEEAAKELQTNLEGRGLTLIRLEDEIGLGTHPEMGEIVKKLTKEEISKDLGKAGLETLTIILYKGPITRSEIDYIRGVNSQFILRNLLIRGLIDRVTNPQDERSYMYKPTFALLEYLGISKVEDMPEFESMKQAIDVHHEALKKENDATT